MQKLAVLALVAASLHAGEPGKVWICNGWITLGEPRDEVLKEISARGCHLIETLNNDENYGVALPGRETTADQVLWQIGFKDGVLSHANEDWSPVDQQNGVELATALHGAVARMLSDLGDVKPSCRISVDQTHGPQVETKTTTFRCENQRVVLSVVDYKGTRSSALVNRFLDAP